MYTPEETEKMLSNLDAIEHYAVTNWGRRLRQHESVSVRWSRYEFGVNWRGTVWFCVGDLTLYFDPDDDDLDDIYKEYTFAEELICCWLGVKAAMEMRLSEIERHRKMIMQFQV